MALEKPYPAHWKKSSIVKRLKSAVVIDPYLISSHQFLQSFDTKDQAEGWLSEMAALDEDGYSGCVVMNKDHAINQYG